ncbi:tetratricopeptide repeat protein [Amaricoccus sp.]|uniref:tetratricopeptide repeat protein n=1 Tax=Amaricoccus sp. TaxID=1872485 RepID=UPI001B50D126|nr:tetratricopeptide repeat protein [Amaricoccus sp.]MBP7001084.1 tetratricopeptide repeat protein [Amaricoccus sp.]
MPALTVTSFAAFANLVVAGCKLATGESPVDRLKALADIATGAKSLDMAFRATGLAAVSAGMARVAEDHARRATHPGPARDDAIALFWQVAPAAFADPSVFAAAHLDPALTADRMVAAIKASPHARDFSATPLPEQFFRAVALATLRVMFDRKDVVDALSPALWRVSLQTTAAIKDDTGAIREDTSELLALMRRMAGTQEAEAAHAAGVTQENILLLARRIAPDVPDLEGAFAELKRAVEIAAEVQTRGHAGSNTGDFVDAVLARMAALSAEGRDDEAAAEADRAFAEWQERQQLERQKGHALLEAGLRADLLRRDARSAARRIVQRIEIETPDPASIFDALRRERDEWYVRGRDKALNLDLDVSIELARLSVGRAKDRDQTGAGLNKLGHALARLGARESGTARLEEAVAAYRAALKEYARDRTPLDWARTQNNLGAALRTLGARESGTARLEEAVAAYRAALEEYARERAPLDWARTQNNLGAALRTLGERESGTARLEEAVASCRAALEEYPRDRTPLDWARTQNNLGAALRTLGERESGTARLKEAVAACRAALEERTRDRTPLGWAMTHNNLGAALQTLGERESGTARLKEAVAAYRAALEERTRDRMPLDWAMSTGNQGVALRLLAERTSDAAMAKLALDQIVAAEAEMRAGGHLVGADFCAAQIPEAQVLAARLAAP